MASTSALAGWRDDNFVDPSGHHIYLGGDQRDPDGEVRTYIECFSPNLAMNWIKAIPIQTQWADSSGFFVGIGSYLNTNFYGATHTLATLKHYNVNGNLDGTLTYSPPASSALIFQFSETGGDIYTCFWGQDFTNPALPQYNSAFQLLRLKVGPVVSP